MPPEQLWGSELDRTVDTYALSVVLWEMLTGRRLFKGETEMETMRRIVEDAVVPPSTFVPDAAPLDAIVMRGLSRDPSKRFATALEMAREISRALTPAPRLEIADWVGELARPSIERRSELLRAMRRGDPPPFAATLTSVETALTSRPSSNATALAHTMSHSTALRAGGAGEARTSRFAIFASAALIAAATVFAVRSPSVLGAEAATVVDIPPGDAPPYEPTGVLTLLSGSLSSSVPVPVPLPSHAAATKPRPPKPTHACPPLPTLDAGGSRHFKEECP
jgi:serine/threonine-protein kinase